MPGTVQAGEALCRSLLLWLKRSVVYLSAPWIRESESADAEEEARILDVRSPGAPPRPSVRPEAEEEARNREFCNNSLADAKGSATDLCTAVDEEDLTTAGAVGEGLIGKLVVALPKLPKLPALPQPST
mmetsp:Transcript_49762/g.131916  ORF Transcript_49762/g.131916 Transcript_49762/m.131916 type:complete len:129 (+) Transcript_49762:176-562(+)